MVPQTANEGKGCPLRRVAHLAPRARGGMWRDSMTKKGVSFQPRVTLNAQTGPDPTEGNSHHSCTTRHGHSEVLTGTQRNKVCPAQSPDLHVSVALTRRRSGVRVPQRPRLDLRICQLACRGTRALLPLLLPVPRLDAEVADRAEQPQPDDLVGFGHRDQPGEVGGGRPSRERPQDLGATVRGSFEEGSRELVSELCRARTLRSLHQVARALDTSRASGLASALGQPRR